MIQATQTQETLQYRMFLSLIGNKTFNDNGSQVPSKPNFLLYTLRLHTDGIPTKTFTLQSRFSHRSLITNEDSYLMGKSYFNYTFYPVR